ncbi:MAG: ABC transporter ATP-binding protein [Pseudomonadota bacterium]
MNSEVAIEVNNLTKEYRLGTIGHGTLYRDLQSWWATARGKEDPNSKVLSPSSYSLASPSAQESFLSLNDVSFKVKQGEVLGVIGRNGAGKSTLLKILSRITAPTAGEIKLRGRIASLLEVGTGFHAELTGRENVFLNGAILGMTTKEIAKKFDEIVAFSEIEKFIDTPVKRYSSGMTVRLAFSVAAHLEAEILLVDEVLAVGDLNFRKKCLGKMRDISNNSGRTVLFVSHDMSAIQNICNTGLLLDRGAVSYAGTATEAVQKYLEGSEAITTKMEWISANTVRPFSEIVSIEKYHIEHEDQEVVQGRLFASKKYNVIVEATLLQNDPRLMFMIAFYSNERTLLFATEIHDTGDFNFEQMGLGRVRFSIPMPTHLFKNNAYEIELLSCLHHTGWILPPDNETRIKFEYFCDTDLNPYLHENRLGILAPVIKWTTNSENK